MSKETGGQAFPRLQWEYDGHNNVLQYQEDGMTLRDYLAAKVMQGDWACQADKVGNDIDTELLKVRAEVYYLMADAMLRARGQ